MNNKNILFIIIFLGIVFIGGWFFFNRDSEHVTSFEECQNAGYPIMESYPRRCSSPNGKTFTEEVGEVPVDINISIEDSE